MASKEFTRTILRSGMYLGCAYVIYDCFWYEIIKLGQFKMNAKSEKLDPYKSIKLKF